MNSKDNFHCNDDLYNGCCFVIISENNLVRLQNRSSCKNSF